MTNVVTKLTMSLNRLRANLYYNDLCLVIRHLCIGQTSSPGYEFSNSRLCRHRVRAFDRITDNDVIDSTRGLREHGSASRPLVLAEAVSSGKSCRGYQPKDEASHMY